MILLVGIGYAFLSTNLNITGTTVLKDNRWDIHLENVVVTTGSVSSTLPTLDTNRTTVSYSVSLNTPGDFYEFTVDAKNDGSIDGMIESFTSLLNGNPITTLPNALEYSVTYSDGVEIENNQILEAGEKETFKVRVAYKRDIEIGDLPSIETTLNLVFTITYVQADSSSIPVEHSRTVYTANIYDGNEEVTNTPVWLGRTIPNPIVQYASAQEALTTLRTATSDDNIQFYLKHTVQNNIVTESYVEFIVTPEMATNNPEMTAGTYALRGLDTSVYDQTQDDYVCKSEYLDSQTGNCLSPYYEANKQVLLSAFGSLNCTDNSSNFVCYTSLFARVDGNGYVEAYDGSYGCIVEYAGTSECRGW